jgi:hypothetical protein
MMDKEAAQQKLIARIAKGGDESSRSEAPVAKPPVNDTGSPDGKSCA